MLKPENVERIMTTGRDANDRIEAHVLAVDPLVSRQGTDIPSSSMLPPPPYMRAV